ncbi:hypothetical protein MCUN1_002834 [Malassezia cuniculi]|uniref:WW domain-containing protein n=1 Tax=Malassezia cuniculi TaxID=948313 RepID=A0AAF0F0F6_9BASI|nr:hypothetical protein MCUN1_002834 [Malassezia cuniculi]
MGERPSSKVAIPGTDGWLRVTTTHGNVFYAQKGTKRSEWHVPEEIREQVEAMDGRKKRRIDDTKEKRAEAEPPYDPTPQPDPYPEPESESMPEHTEPVDPEIEAALAAASEAAARVRAEGGPIIEGDEEEAEETVPAPQAPIVMAPPPNLSLEEGQALFMSMLTSLNGTPSEINPMSPWDRELPKFVHLPMYSALPGTREREDAFNEWCKLRIREKREAKRHQSSAASSNASAKEAYMALLRNKVVSTRTKFGDFSSKYSKDPRFTEFAASAPFSSLVELFDSWIVELTKKKRAAAQRADEAFDKLLTEKLPSARSLVHSKKSVTKEECADIWLSAKKTKGLVEDQRYDAVGSATRRSELFFEWLNRGLAQAPRRERDTTRALREREEQVRREQARVSGKVRAARRTVEAEQRESDFRQLLIDAVRDPHETWAAAQARLARDPRFSTPHDPLLPEDKAEFFEEHVAHIRERRRDQLARLFAKHARYDDGTERLDIDPDVVVTLVASDPEYENSGVRLFVGTKDSLAQEYAEWDAWRKEQARNAFEDMLNENAFVDFWGRLRKERERQESCTVNTDVKADDEDEDQAGASILDMASAIELKEIESVLRVREFANENDLRYRIYAHIPEQRTEWIRDHLRKLAVPRQTIHQYHIKQ